MNSLQSIAQLIRYWILVSTTKAGSGHATSSLSAVELMAALMFGGFFRYDVRRPGYHNNDRLIFSKGHASPLFYALWAAAGGLSEKELLTLRAFGSRLEGHPTLRFPFTEAATGSLGQGLSIGVGMALNAKYLDHLPYRTFVLLGDSEMAEGQVWEALQIATHYTLDNLIGILDVNRLGQSGETMVGHRPDEYEKRIASFGWKTFVINGHSVQDIMKAYRAALRVTGKPVMIIAKTHKGKGISLLEDKNGWHGKALSNDELKVALHELEIQGPVDRKIRGKIAMPSTVKIVNTTAEALTKSKAAHHNFQSLNMPAFKPPSLYKADELVATRRAYGVALAREMARDARIVALDAEVSNSTYSEIARAAHPTRFFEMYIAEQNMVGAALGLARRGKKPFVSTFAAFLTRAHDQIRMAQYSDADICFVGSHAGVAIGEDGASQMGLEDIALFRSILGSVVLYPSDAVSTEKIVSQAVRHKGVTYIRTTRNTTPILYKPTEQFPIGGSKVLRKSAKDRATIIAAGITVHEALKAYEILKKKKIAVRVIDCYCIKPIDSKTIRQAARETGAIISVEDHYAEGGLGEAVAAVLAGTKVRYSLLAVKKVPRSGNSSSLLAYEKIDCDAIVQAARHLIT